MHRITIIVEIQQDKWDLIPQQSQEHLNNLLAKTAGALATKYITGQLEHGGFLLDRDCLFEAYNEALDLITYLDALITVDKGLYDDHTQRSNH